MESLMNNAHRMRFLGRTDQGGRPDGVQVMVGFGSQSSVAVIAGIGTGTGWQLLLTTEMSGGQ